MKPASTYMEDTPTSYKTLPERRTLIKKLLCFPNICHVIWNVPLGDPAAAAAAGAILNYQINI